MGFLFKRRLLGNRRLKSYGDIFLSKVGFNVGDLEFHNFKNLVKAEENFLKAISNNASFEEGYRALYELYRYGYTSKKDQAPKILEQGITRNPHAINLMTLLASYYKDIGDKGKAIVYYNKALTEAQSLGNQQLINSFQQEIANLK